MEHRRNRNILVSSLFLGVLFFFSISGNATSTTVSCECPKVECDTCHDETGVDFVSEKCGPNLSKVRSCAKPKCEMKPEPPVACKAKKIKVENKVVHTKKNQSLPSTIGNRGRTVGKIKVIKGSVTLQSDGGQVRRLGKNGIIRENETISTSKNTFAEVRFADGNQVDVSPDSELKVEHYDNDSHSKKRAILELIKGKVRSRVKKKYKSKTSYFRVKTRGSVAGVRGTDFTVAIIPSGGKWETKVQTLEGHVVLSDLSMKESVDILAGEGASFVVAANGNSAVFSGDDIDEFMKRGYLTPVYKLSASELSELKNEKKDSKRLPASAKLASPEYVCDSPKAQFNYCSWTCENNPKGSKACRTDLKKVSCVRKRCDAKGQWVDSSRLPASSSESCTGSGLPKVGPCDY